MRNLNQAFQLISLSISILLIASCASKKPASGKGIVARMEVKEPIPGVCDNDNVFALSIMSLMDPAAAKDASCAITEAEMEKRLNTEVVFLKQNPEFNGKGMMSLIINCKGEVVRCEIDNESESTELDAQILAVFKTFTSWKAGTYNGKPVDSSQLFSYTIEKGVLKL